MIIVRIMGGLGNQMFQYAFGRAVAAETGRELVLDLTSMPTGSGPNLRRWELSNLSIPPLRKIGAKSLERHPESTRGFSRRSVSLVFKALRRFRIDEPPGDRVLDSAHLFRPVAHCVGYWQSHLYFDWMGEVIRSELKPRKELSTAVSSLLRAIVDRETIAVHVRRGDYVTESHVARVHRALPVRYYEGALLSIAEQLHRPIAVVFSDDPDWAVKNLRFGIETIHAERHRGFSAIETLVGISRCAHHVIANSSLSWWGAYLAAHSDQLVIYPNRWFRDRTVDARIRFPAYWRPHDAT